MPSKGEADRKEFPGEVTAAASPDDVADISEPKAGGDQAEKAAEESAEPVELSREQLQELVERLYQELAASRDRAEGYYRRLLRMEADFENYRRRTQAEKAEQQLYAGQRIITSLLSVLDNLERALAAANQTRDLEALLQGLELVYREFKDLLHREGLQGMEVLGQDFNPELHEALAQVPADEVGKTDNTIVEEYQKGYLLRGKVIRPARVAVAKGSPADQPPSTE
ncbi:MAG: nucleotide exchange factor GrpE [Syntrophomonadaceae bacterium]|nr:nucleotide exchange factor GrpE [Syntrophomonadaceae bacterium]